MLKPLLVVAAVGVLGWLWRVRQRYIKRQAMLRYWLALLDEHREELRRTAVRKPNLATRVEALRSVFTELPVEQRAYHDAWCDVLITHDSWFGAE